jgi:tripartite-type tricarboxylate transporter receptor subunit TctC
MARRASRPRNAQGADRHGGQGHQDQGWAEALEKNNWTAALMTGKDFDDFVDREFATLRATMVKAGMI